MTEFEMAYLQNDMLLALAAASQYFFAMVTAFVVAAYLVAHRLTRTMVIIIVSMFTIASAGSIVMIFRIMQSLGGLANEMRAFAQAGKGLAWHSVMNMPPWGFESARYVGTALFIAAAAASIYFFFHSRRVNRIAEAPRANPQAQNDLRG